MGPYEKYLKICNWTNAFVGYFFGQNEENVYLYVDEEIINQIGTNNDLGNIDSFLEAILLSYAEKCDIYDFFRNYHNVLQPRDTAINRNLNAGGIFAFAGEYLTQYDQPYYLPYIILAVYIAGTAQENDDNAIGKRLETFIQERIENDAVDYSYLETMFERLRKQYPAFQNRRQGEQRYIGLLRRQLLLSKNQIEEIRAALYRIRYENDRDIDYVTKCESICNYVNEQVRGVIRDSMQNPDLQYRINSIFENFNLEYYQEHLNNEHNEQEFRNFALLLDFSESRGFRLLSNYRPIECIEHRSYLFEPSIDSIGEYSDKFVIHDGNEFVELRNYSLDTESLRITPLPLGEVVFFFKYDERRYLQSRKAYNKKVYVFVRDNHQSINRWEVWAKDNATNFQRIPSEMVEDLTQNEWVLYRADGVMTSYYAGEYWNNNVRSIQKSGGMLCTGEKDVYLVNALPSFKFPNEIIQTELILKVAEENEELVVNTDYRYFIQENKLIIDFIKDIGYERSRRITVNVEYNDQNDPLEAEYIFSVRGQSVIYAQNNLFCYNNWGERIENQEEFCIQGNIVAGPNPIEIGNERYMIEADANWQPDFANDFYFINLLASCAYMDPTTQITKERLKKCIKNAIIRLKIEEAQEKKFITKVIGLLVNNGYIAVNHVTSHYQAIPPAFVKIPQAFYHGGQQVWMLVGTYTRRFINELVCYCRTKKINFRKMPDRHLGSFRLLPPIILLESSFNPSDFKNQYQHHSFDVCHKHDQALNIISLVPCITEYDNMLERIPRDRVDVVRFVNPQLDEFPRVREDAPYQYNNHVYIEEAENGNFLRPTVSEKWNDLFCYVKRGKPFIIEGNQHIYLPDDLRLPSLLQRSLFIMNMGTPVYKRVFICDNASSRMYEVMKSFTINNTRRQFLYRKITGNEDAKNNPCIRQKVGSNSFRMELWVKRSGEELNLTLPERILVLWYREEPYQYEIIAISSKGNVQKSFVKRENNFQEVNSCCNEIMSFIIKNPRWTYNDINFVRNNPEIFTLPDKEKYDIEEIKIL